MHSGDGYDLASTLSKYDLRKDDLFVLSWARGRRLMRGGISSELLICGGGVRSILLFPLMTRCLETIDVCIWCMLCVCCSHCVGVCGNVCCVAVVVKVFSLGVLNYVNVMVVMDVVFSVCIVTRGAVGARVCGVWLFHHADVVCLCLVCILWQFTILHSA